MASCYKGETSRHSFCRSNICTCSQGTKQVWIVRNGLSIIQCTPLDAAAALPWYQLMPWVFVLIALAASAVLVALAW